MHRREHAASRCVHVTIVRVVQAAGLSWTDEQMWSFKRAAKLGPSA